MVDVELEGLLYTGRLRGQKRGAGRRSSGADASMLAQKRFCEEQFACEVPGQNWLVGCDFLLLFVRLFLNPDNHQEPFLGLRAHISPFRSEPVDRQR